MTRSRRAADPWRSEVADKSVARLTTGLRNGRFGFEDIDGKWLSADLFFRRRPESGRQSVGTRDGHGEATGGGRRDRDHAQLQDLGGYQVGTLRESGHDPNLPMLAGERQKWTARSRLKLEEHGTAYQYDKGKCRCDICRAGNAERQRRRRSGK